MESDDLNQILVMKTVLEAENGDDKILRALKRLNQFRMTVDLLQNTGIGKVVNQYRKRDGPVGPFARALVNKWKQDVAKMIAETAETAEEATSSPARKRSVSPDIERSVKRARTSPQSEQPDVGSLKSTEDTRTRLSFADYMKDKDRGTSSSRSSTKDSLSSKEKPRSSSRRKDEHSGLSLDVENAISALNDDIDRSERHQIAEKSKHSERAHSGEARDKFEHDKPREKSKHGENSREKSRHGESSREKSENGESSREKSKHGESSRHKSKHGESSREKSEHRGSSREKSKHGESSREKSKHREGSREKSKHGESSREKSKHGESSREKSKHGESSREKSKHGESSREKSKHGESSREKSKHSENSREKSKHGESSREKSKHDESSREKSKHSDNSREKPGHSENKKLNTSSEISSESGSDRTGRKRVTERRSTLPQFHIPTPQQHMGGLHEADILASLPQTVTNYKPLPRFNQGSPSKLRAYDQEIGTKKHSRSVMYSGRRTRTLQEVPSLFDACLEVLMDNIDSIDCVGAASYFILKPVLLKCTPEQLYNIENMNTHLLEDTDELWSEHCKKDFRGKTRNSDDCETWRELYLRQHEEREHKLKKLTANISKQHSALKDAGRKTKLAFVETLAKPPRDVLRRQKMHGTGGPVHKAVDPLEKLTSRGGQPGKSSIRAPIMKNQVTNHIVSPPSVRPSAASKKPVAAPMMARTMKMMQKMRR